MCLCLSHLCEFARGPTDGKEPPMTMGMGESEPITSIRRPFVLATAAQNQRQASRLLCYRAASMKEKKKDGEGSGRPRGSRKNIIGRYGSLL